MSEQPHSPNQQLETRHRIKCHSATDMPGVAPESVQLVVTSPPYPMIAMWDGIFASQSESTATALAAGRCDDAFESMHALLDRVWVRAYHVLAEGGFLCINVGDAVRSCDGEFRMYSNYARIVQSVTSLGFTMLPSIVWRKPTNSPTKFMGSGMLPGGAYVTLEHEEVIICRKGIRPVRSSAERSRRRRSAIFWEERNEWYSDLWSFTGARQAIGPEHEVAGTGNGRMRSAAFPLELPFRLICMYSWIGDTVLDPFSGTGTTTCAAIAAGRNSIGIDADPTLTRLAIERIGEVQTLERLQIRSRQRITDHCSFIDTRKTNTRHRHSVTGYPVVTNQEKEITVPIPTGLTIQDDEAACRYRSALPGDDTEKNTTDDGDRSVL